MKETLSVELTPKDVERLMTALNTESLRLSSQFKIEGKKIDTDCWQYKEWLAVGELWAEFYDIKHDNKTVEVWA